MDGEGHDVELDVVADALDVHMAMRMRPRPMRERARDAPAEVVGGVGSRLWCALANLHDTVRA